MPKNYREPDPKWDEVKKIIDKRDKKQCQFMRCLSATEFHQLNVGHPKTIDRCHIFPRSSYPELIYNTRNIISLQRFIHHRMDEYLHPLNGDRILANEHFYWWWRILNKSIEKYDSTVEYELKLLEKIRG